MSPPSGRKKLLRFPKSVLQVLIEAWRWRHFCLKQLEYLQDMQEVKSQKTFSVTYSTNIYWALSKPSPGAGDMRTQVLATGKRVRCLTQCPTRLSKGHVFSCVCVMYFIYKDHQILKLLWFLYPWSLSSAVSHLPEQGFDPDERVLRNPTFLASQMKGFFWHF